MAMSRIRAFSAKHPLLINCLSLSSIYAGADLTQQSLKGVEQYDKKSPVRMAVLASGYFAPAYYLWYIWLDKFLPGRLPRTIAAKVMMDQGIMGAVGSAVFFFGNSVLEGKHPRTAVDETKKRWPTAYFVGWLYWPVAQTINFVFLPTAFRTVYVGLAAFAWTTFLVYIKEDNTVDTKSELQSQKEIHQT